MKSLHQNEAGLTLIEVLIALAILAIALTAIIQSTAQNIKNTLYLQNRTIATWIASDMINNIRVGVIKVPSGSFPVAAESIVLGQTWSYNAKVDTTPNPNIKKIDVTVSLKPENVQFAHLEGYLYGG